MRALKRSASEFLLWALCREFSFLIATDGTHIGLLFQVRVGGTEEVLVIRQGISLHSANEENSAHDQEPTKIVRWSDPD